MVIGADFWSALLGARTFWIAVAPPVAAIWLMGGAVLALLALRRRAAVPLSQIHHDTRGAASVLDLVLVAPIFTLIMIAFLQWAVLLNDTIFVHYAAFSAARSARVNMCPAFPTNAGEVAQIILDDCDKARVRYLNAARFALIPASPFARRDDGCSTCQDQEDALRALAQGLRMEPQTDAWLRQARYAFNDENVQVEVTVPLIAEIERIAGGNRERPVTATVRYRHVLMPVVERVYRDGTLPDGTPYVVITAQMTLI